jgi:drug/metabolite transporter (DMT)-like permease
MADAAKPMMGDRVALGVGMIIISTMCTATQDATFKFASSGMTIWQIFAIRSVFLIPILLIIAGLWGRSRGIWATALSIWPVTRAIMFILMYVSMFSVIPFLNLAVVAAGLYTGPLWVALFSPLLMRERVSLLECIAICFGFCGILLNLRPGTDAFSWATLMPSAIITRSKCRNTEPLALSLALAVALLMMGSLCSLVLLIVQPPAELVSKSAFLFGQWSGMGAAEWVVIAVLTAVLAVNSVVLPIAYQSAKTVIVATFDYMYLVWSPLIGFAVFSEVPDTYTIIAMLMIAGAGLLILRAGK